MTIRSPRGRGDRPEVGDVTTRTARRLAGTIVVVYLLVDTSGIVLQFVTHRPEDAVVGLPGKTASAIAFLAWAVAGATIAGRQPRNPIGWILCGIALHWAVSDFTFGYATETLITHPGALPGGPLAADVYTSAFFLVEPLLALLFLLFPSGTVLSRRWRIVGWVAAFTGITLFVGTMFAEGPIELFPIENPYGVVPQDAPGGWILFFLLFGCVLASVISLAIRWRRSNSEERLQLKWFAYAAAFLPAAFVFYFFGWNGTTDRIGAALLAIAIVGIPIATGIAVLKYRLYDIDLVIRKTVMVGVLAAFATLVYLAIVVGVGTLIGSRGERPSVLLAVVATAVVAVAFQPVRARAERLADRLVYGERATPYDVLSDFSERLAGAFSTEDLLPRMARTLAEGTGSARADVWLRLGDRLRPEATWPVEAAPLEPIAADGDSLTISGADLAVPVRHQGELLGAVTITKKPGEPPTPVEERLVDDLAAQAGLVMSNVRLIEELRASRQRLVSAQDEERRKIERNLHDGAQQQLVALAVKERLAEDLIARDPDRARAVITQIRSETVEALETLRDLARGIYPPLLADQGLEAALRAQIRKSPVRVELPADGQERFPREIEAAAYFCCLEALQNVAKYARASEVIVEIGSHDGALTFVVSDDGVGFDPSGTAHGTGLRGMADRVDAVGGSLEIASRPSEGTTIAGRIPTAP